MAHEEYILVPREPTEAMREAGADHLFGAASDDWGDDAAEVWSAMLAAASPAPTEGVERGPSREDIEWLGKEFLSLSYAVENEYVCDDAGHNSMKADRERAERIVAALIEGRSA